MHDPEVPVVNQPPVVNQAPVQIDSSVPVVAPSHTEERSGHDPFVEVSVIESVPFQRAQVAEEDNPVVRVILVRLLLDIILLFVRYEKPCSAQNVCGDVLKFVPEKYVDLAGFDDWSKRMTDWLTF